MYSNFEISVNRTELLERLKQNRSKHVEEFLEAARAYKEAYLAELENTLNDTRKADDISIVEVRTPPGRPMCYRKEYDAIIEMVEASQDETLRLSKEQFGAYWKDEWDWQRSFKKSARYYGSGEVDEFDDALHF